MPKVTDIKAYWRETATKAGLTAEKVKQVEELFDDPNALKAFTDGFKPLPDYSHDLDDVRTKTTAAVDAKHQKIYEENLAKYNEYVAGLDKLKKYEEVYGPLDVQHPPDPNLNRGGKTLTQEEIDKLVETKLTTVLNDTLARRDSAVLDLLEVREFHMEKFKKSLDVKAFEAAWKEHPEWGGSLKQAYKSFVEPEIEKTREADIEARIKAAREEGIRDGYSRRALPTDSAAKEFSPMFDRKAEIDKMDEAAQERHSREAFFAGLTEKQPA
jgi:hypothetical protein